MTIDFFEVAGNLQFIYQSNFFPEKLQIAQNRDLRNTLRNLYLTQGMIGEV